MGFNLLITVLDNNTSYHLLNVSCDDLMVFRISHLFPLMLHKRGIVAPCLIDNEMHFRLCQSHAVSMLRIQTIFHCRDHTV